jgi:tRNA (cmo5U34)-methyltransferase
MADINLWSNASHALEYLARADDVLHRTEGESTLLECLPTAPTRVLDLGCGDGRLVDLVRGARPGIAAVAIDFSEEMLRRVRARFAGDSSVTILAHDMNHPLPATLGTFDAVVSSFAIHHLPHERKRTLYEEVHQLLTPAGVFCNLEHVASPTSTLHQEFLDRQKVKREEEDPSNKLLDLEIQLTWFREIGFEDVDCLWKYRELALLVGRKAN